MNIQALALPHRVQALGSGPCTTLALAQASELIGAYEKAINHYEEYQLNRPELAGVTSKSITRCKQRVMKAERISHSRPILSIIIPCHNSEEFVEDCLSSVLAQTATRIEIIVVDDGSIDRTPTILHEFSKIDSRIKLITNKNPSGSAGTPRNQGLAISQGSYVGFVDSDDSISPDYFENMLVEAIMRDADLVINSGFVNVGANMNAEERSYKETDRIVYDSEKLSCNHSSSMIWDKIYSRNLLLNNDIRLGTYPAAVDVPFVFKAYYYCRNPIRVLNNGYFYRRETLNSVTVRHRKSSNCDFELKAFDESFAWAKEMKVNNEYIAYMQIKQLTSFIYTCKLIPLGHLQKYFNQCSRKLQCYPADFLDTLSIAKRNYLARDFEIFRCSDLRTFINAHRKSDADILLAVSKKNHIPKSIHLASQKSRNRIVFFPDWSISNPYQKLLYQAISENYETDCFGLDIEDVCEANISSLLGQHNAFVHIHWLHPFLDSIRFENLKYTLLRAKKNGAKILWTIHNIISHESEEQQKEIAQRRQIFELADYVFCHSSSAIKAVHDTYKVNVDKIYLLEHGAYPPPSLNPQDSCHKPSAKQLRLAILGELRPYKNTEKAISLLERVNQSLPSQHRIELVIGGKPSSNEQSSLLKSLEAKFDWLFLDLNRLPEEKMIQYIHDTDFVFLPYTRIQTSGLAILALSNGKPFIGPSMGDLIELGNSYCKILYQNDQDLISKLLRLGAQSREVLAERMHPSVKILDFAKSISWQNALSRSKLGTILASE